MKGDHFKEGKGGRKEAQTDEPQRRHGKSFRERATLFDEQPVYFRDCRRQREDKGGRGE